MADTVVAERRSSQEKEMRPTGNAIDVILIASEDGSFYSTEWHVMFGWSNFKSNVRAGVGDVIDIYVNDVKLNVSMKLLEYGRCTFDHQDNEYLPPTTINWSECHLKLDGTPNSVRFQHVRDSRTYTRVVECDLYVWQPNDFAVIVDLDGTITISDVEGHIRTLRLGQYDYMHMGSCDFFTKLQSIGARILYLTARPLNWAGGSRIHIREARQENIGLPLGPVVHKNPHIFKTGVLKAIQDAMVRAGRTSPHPVFVAGFGNRPSDTLAYTDAGVPLNATFLIDPESKLQAPGSEIFGSYCDPKALLWLLPKIKYKVPIDFVRQIDELTAKELDREEDIELFYYVQRDPQPIVDVAENNPSTV
ncbi:lipin [Thraustotheca clavata]|uniref:Lipin n=1 Tax=Thraustotheca clavata TaxID=74557 RepID=A0A1V9ZNF1_9STRA|nr:lipin [Thraustotheca clavata]